MRRFFSNKNIIELPEVIQHKKFKQFLSNRHHKPIQIKKDFEYYSLSMKEAMSAIYNFGEGLDVEKLISN